MARPRKDQQIDISARAIVQTIRLLNERDMRDITLAEVASAIGCRAPALYSYFAGKDALLHAVHDEGFRILLEEKLTVAASNVSDPFVRLREGGLTYLRFAIEYPGLYQLMFSPSYSERGNENPFSSDPGAACLAELRSSIELCQAEGYLPGADAVQTAFSLWSAVHGAASLILLGRKPMQQGLDGLATATGVVDTMMSFVQLSRFTVPNPNFR
ncbi:TPA: TetR/AcrR family transcriptional regulator [Klebsiella oxytoca]|nr:TetR/AcrR family transcriptional regulator [Klebsiella oxytoca]